MSNVKVDYKIIRPTVSDAESIIKHLNKVGGETNNLTYGKDECDFTVEQEIKFLAKIEKEKIKPPFFIVKNQKGKVIAVATCFSRKRKRLSHVSELGISVQKNYWRKGIGNALMDRLIEYCKAIGVEKIELRVNADNKEAIALYKKKDFEIEGFLKREKKIDSVYYDTYIMSKFL
jgi:RimJ/RimL family protein N-acetyltransferase